MNELRLELHRAFFNKNMLKSLLLGSLLVFCDLSKFCDDYIKHDCVLVQAWIGTNYQYAFNSIFFVLFPIIACLPFGWSLYTDISIGYDKNICVKTSRKNYIYSKCLAVFLSGAFAVAVPLFVDLFIAAGLFQNRQPERLEGLVAGAVIDRELFSEIFAYNAGLFCLIFIIIDALFAGIIALISLAITKLTGSFFTVVVVPFVLFVFQEITMIGDTTGNWAIMEMINPIQNVTTKWYQMLIAYIVVLFLSLGISVIVNRKRDLM